MRKLTYEEIAQQRFPIEQLKVQERMPVYLLLDNVRSLYNVGAIFRSADGARVAKIFLCGYTPCPPRKEIEKTALGATATVPWEHFREPRDILLRLKSEGIPIYVLEHTDNSVPYYTLTKKNVPLCLVIGNEITGVSKEIISLADAAIDIPMFGMKQSLNVAVAAGIAMFDVVRIINNP